MTPARNNELLHGTLETLILKTLAEGPRHGYAIARWLEGAWGDSLQIEDGSLYPALYRLEKRRLIRGEWGVSSAGRRARFYRLTDLGRRQLAERLEEWTRFSLGVSRMLGRSQS